MIKFDELHYSIKKEGNVPFVGNIMVSRWAYEALAVEQYKNNEYEKLFFESDRKISENSYKASYLIPRLERELNNASQFVSSKDSVSAQKIFRILKTELTSLSENGALKFTRTADLSFHEFDSSTFKAVASFLDSKKNNYRRSMDIANAERETSYKNVVESIGKDGLLELKNNYHNKGIANLVLNRDELEKIYEGKYRLIQKKDPIYKTPTTSTGNAHFYGPVKKVGNIEIDTFWFNLLAIWSLSALLYMTLRVDALKIALNTASSLGRRKFRD
jgi:ABC transport system ATP-binding/permease protein